MLCAKPTQRIVHFSMPNLHQNRAGAGYSDGGGQVDFCLRNSAGDMPVLFLNWRPKCV
jgi:hypothetical protein